MIWIIIFAVVTILYLNYILLSLSNQLKLTLQKGFSTTSSIIEIIDVISTNEYLNNSLTKAKWININNKRNELLDKFTKCNKIKYIGITALIYIYIHAEMKKVYKDYLRNKEIYIRTKKQFEDYKKTYSEQGEHKINKSYLDECLELLMITEDFSKKELKQSFRNKAKKFHPDNNVNHKDTTEIFKQYVNAYDYLLSM
ncbi:MAG TPA: DnaJ domain-containing protein [Clostridiales bacterium]|nr:DnaJ domain-containing protein [Clostridiales bacterium]